MGFKLYKSETNHMLFRFVDKRWKSS